MTVTPEDVLTFWFEEAGPKRWYKKDPAFDALVADRFEASVLAAKQGALDHWQQTPLGVLALVILLDQVTRNIYRDRPEAFACDAKARAVVHGAMAAGHDRQLTAEQRHFLYMPFMHSEDLADQDRAVALGRDLDGEDFLKYAELHREVIVRFGRFPHRNAALGRETTDEEQAWLDAGGGF